MYLLQLIYAFFFKNFELKSCYIEYLKLTLSLENACIAILQSTFNNSKVLNFCCSLNILITKV